MIELAKLIYLEVMFARSAYVTRNNYAAYQASLHPWLTQ